MPQEIGGRKVIIVAQGGEPVGHQNGETHETVGAAEHEAPENPLAEHPPLYYSGVGLLVIVLILAFSVFCKSKGLVLRNASKRQTLLEQAVASITFFTRNAIGEGGEKFAPLIGTVFSFILVSNLMGVVPVVLHRGHEAGSYSSLLPAPTANLSITLAVALVVFGVVQWVGIKENGVGGYIKHFAGPIPALSPLIFPLEIIGAIAKPISLSIRLFGNVFGEETVIAVLIGLAVTTLPIFAPIPFHLPMLMFGVFGSIVQAGVFTILTCAYLSLAIGDHDDHGHGSENGDVHDEFGAHIATGGHPEMPPLARPTH